MGVSSNIIRARTKAKQSQRHIYIKYTSRKQQQINSASLSTRENRVALAVGELERVPVLTVTSPVQGVPLLFLIMKGGLFFCYPVTSLAFFKC